MSFFGTEKMVWVMNKKKNYFTINASSVGKLLDESELHNRKSKILLHK